MVDAMLSSIIPTHLHRKRSENTSKSSETIYFHHQKKYFRDNS